MKNGAWKAWLVFAAFLLVHGIVGEMELRDLERMRQSPVVAEVSRW